eukprot:2933384-Alexandrium_andersonii.AAC.1
MGKGNGVHFRNGDWLVAGPGGCKASGTSMDAHGAVGQPCCLLHPFCGAVGGGLGLGAQWSVPSDATPFGRCGGL